MNSQSPLLRPAHPRAELVPQFGSRSEVFGEEGNTTKLQQQSLQSSSSSPLAGTTIPPGLQLISHCIQRGDVGLEEPPMSLPCPTAMQVFGYHTNHLSCPWNLCGFTGTTNVSDVACPQIQFPRWFLQAPCVTFGCHG